MTSSPAPVLGLRANRRQFGLLVLVNAFVGAMVGLERTVLPLIAERELAVASTAAALSFIATFGAVKAVMNLVAGRLGDRFGRKRVLVAGWLAGAPVPLLVMWAPSWSWIVAANMLLGVNQGLAWSMTVVMKIDLVGPARRGLAMGLNEFAGYLAVALAALVTGVIAGRLGLRPEPFYLGIALVLVGLAVTLLFVRDTAAHARLEGAGAPGAARELGTRELIAHATWRDPALSTASVTGFVNNLNDGLAWGLFPLLFAGAGLSLETVGLLVSAYPASWGLAQLGTGALSDRIGRKAPIVAGMTVQGVALVGIALSETEVGWLFGSVVLGVGTALAYPTLLAAIGDVAHPAWRGSAVGVYRFWRDLGYVGGALLGGILADRFGIPIAIGAIGVITVAAAVLAIVRLPETRPVQRAALPDEARNPSSRPFTAGHS